MAALNLKRVFKRDASGRTIIQQLEKVELAIKQGNADYRSSGMSEKVRLREDNASGSRR
jgi:hypothetical protein